MFQAAEIELCEIAQTQDGRFAGSIAQYEASLVEIPGVESSVTGKVRKGCGAETACDRFNLAS